MRFLNYSFICVVLHLFNLNLVWTNQSLMHRQVILGNYGRSYTLSVNKSHEFIVEFTNNTSIYPTRVTIISEAAVRDDPILVVAQQHQIIQSWQLPLVGDMKVIGNDYTRSAHTLCPETMKLIQSVPTQMISKRLFAPEECSNPTITIKTSSPENVSFVLNVEIVKNFFIKAGVDYSFTVTASGPVYYYYNFNDFENMANNSDAVLVTASSETGSCMLFSIQNSTCPVQDLENNIKFDSYWQTMSNKAAMVVTKRRYPHGFYIVMVVKHDDIECSEQFAKWTAMAREKIVKLRISPTITLHEHNLTAYVTLVIFGVCLLLTIIGGIAYFVRTLRYAKEHPAILTEASEAMIIDDDRNVHWGRLCIFACTSMNRSASNYVWLVVIVLLFYILPVLQVAVTYQSIVNDTGNDDICYYNFLCALPHTFIIQITDFNHVLSNIGYVFLGVAFIVLTYLKGMRECTKQRPGYGIVKPYGLYYALGIALIMEGIMSACYHICPKKSNFQFDTSFMYVMSVLMIVNVYENRQKDVRNRDERGYIVFFILAGATAISVLGSYVGTKLIFWIIFTIMHIIGCMFITWILEGNFIKAIFRRASRHQMTCVDIFHGILLLCMNGINVALAIFGLLFKYSFATHLLVILIANGVLYTNFYIIMKMMHKEKILKETPILIILAVACWVPALYFFLTTVTSWEETPAGSRNKNQECMLVRYYDSHDIWHFLSAFALFFTCWILLTLDEGLDNVPSDDIVDFHGEIQVTRNARRSDANTPDEE